MTDLDQSGRIPQVHATWRGPSLGWMYTDEPTEFEFVMASATEITAGLKGYMLCPEWVTVIGWVILSANAGSIQFDIQRKPMIDFLASGPPDPGNSICNADYPTLTNPAIAAASTSVAGWQTQLNQNDVLAFNVLSNFNILKCTIILRCLRNLGTGA